MTITVVFDSLEEFQQHMVTRPTEEELYKKFDNFPDGTSGYVTVAKDGSVHYTREKPQDPAPEPEVPFEEDKPKKIKDTGTGTITGATPEEQKQIEAEEKVNVEAVRKLLAGLNKKAGKNVAKELIKSVGYKRLTDVPQGALLTLRGLAEEEMGKYA